MTPKKYPHFHHTQKTFIFLKTPKQIEVQILYPKNDPILRIYVKI